MTANEHYSKGKYYADKAKSAAGNYSLGAAADRHEAANSLYAMGERHNDIGKKLSDKEHSEEDLGLGKKSDKKETKEEPSSIPKDLSFTLDPTEPEPDEDTQVETGDSFKIGSYKLQPMKMGTLNYLSIIGPDDEVAQNFVKETKIKTTSGYDWVAIETDKKGNVSKKGWETLKKLESFLKNQK